MKRIHVVVLVFISAAALAGTVEMKTQDLKPPGPLEIQPVAEDLYMISRQRGRLRHR